MRAAACHLRYNHLHQPCGHTLADPEVLSMTAMSRGLAVAVLLTLPLTAEAWEHRSRSVASYYSYPAPALASYYYPVPTVAAYYYPVPTVSVGFLAPVTVPVCPSSLPLGAPMPPAGQVPGVSESTSATRPTVTTTAARPSATVRVSFWNRSAADVTLHVDGQARVLARGRGLTLDLPREFAWHVNDRPEETERVPAHEPGIEILIRR